MPFDATNPATFDALRSGDKLTDLVTLSANIIPRHRFRRDIINIIGGTLARGPIKLGAAQPRDSKESLYGWRLTAWVDSPHSPNSRDSQIQKLLFIYTNP